jgi:hypothetical protein
VAEGEAVSVPYSLGFDFNIGPASAGAIRITPSAPIVLAWLRFAELESRWLSVLSHATKHAHRILLAHGPVPVETLTEKTPLARDAAGPGVTLELWVQNLDITPHRVRGVIGLELERFKRGDGEPFAVSPLGSEWFHT